MPLGISCHTTNTTLTRILINHPNIITHSIIKHSTTQACNKQAAQQQQRQQQGGVRGGAQTSLRQPRAQC